MSTTCEATAKIMRDHRLGKKMKMKKNENKMKMNEIKNDE